ncbi:hypothetical protein WJ60_32720 [Burkholderia ubonensis]|uniref:PoNe immunity protein domain-containing protein n=1 Tax=Burkholderia ubonensis TaxID=101571 RepID=UPI000759D7B3|nr:PoNe immunity protein domain-containing protein [Burkholderia ubonensis]KVM75108.1 hypothetical protein WJ60_32720 [Burkholderia ubonensis]
MTEQSNDFDKRRRQRFLDQRYFDWYAQFLKDTNEHWRFSLPANGSEAEQKATAAWLRALGQFQLLLLGFTAGAAIEPMRSDLEEVIVSFEEYTKLNRIVEANPDYPPFVFSDIYLYELTLQLVGLCHLLHCVDLLPRIAAMEDPFYSGQDTLYEDLLAYELEGRYDVDKWFHDKPYRDLINGFYRDTDEESIADLTHYLDNWYPAMAKAPWHGSHLKQADDGGTYYGYWAIEAAAAAFLLELDDSSFRDHLLYPKDLVDFARSYTPKAAPAPLDSGPLKVRTGQRCPQTGIWKAIGHHVPGVRVEGGQVMPEVFAPDKSGAHRMQPAMWEYDRPA